MEKIVRVSEVSVLYIHIHIYIYTHTLGKEFI